MRFYINFKEALSEIKRDLAEMGIDVHPQTMQDKYVANNPDYATKELQNYCYTVLDAVSHVDELEPSQPWAAVELRERLSGIPVNPGKAWTYRPEVWQEFLHDGRFAYTYSERMFWQLGTIINELRTHPDSRQLWLSIWDPGRDILQLGGHGRVPCSLGYLFQLRKSRLNMTYFMRSCDYVTHFRNDVWLAVKLLEHVAQEVGTKPGDFTHFIGSFHVYAKDVKGVF